jgi:hypothetical protein
MMKKIKNASSFYYKKNLPGKKLTQQMFDYSMIDALSLFTDTHPQVMIERIKRKNWNFEYDISFNKLSLRYKGKIFLKKYLGINTYYENYNLI